MRMRTLNLKWLIPVFVLVGCPADDGNGTGGSESSGSSGDATTMNVTVTTTVTTSDSTTVSTSDSTTMGTTMSTTDNSTTDVDSSGTTDATTTDATTTDATTTTDASSSSSGGVVPDGPYGPCDLTDPKDPVCETKGEECNTFDVGAMDPGHWCAIPCTPNDECPAPATGEATAECSAFFGHCALNCTGDLSCPDGMECIEIVMGVVSRCFWT